MGRGLTLVRSAGTRRMQGNRDKAQGTLVGLAAGDRNGGPIRMALRVAESICACGGFNVADIGARYHKWWTEGAFDTGPTVAHVLRLVDAGATFERASRLTHQLLNWLTAGCNPAHRIAPVAMCATIADEHLGTTAQAEANLTHQHPLAGDAAAAVARLCRALIYEVQWQAALDWAALGRGDKIRDALLARHEPGQSSLSRGGFAPQVLAAAVHFVSVASTFDEALSMAINFAGPANYCPVLVGSIGGARWGLSAIGRASYTHCQEIEPRIMAVADSLGRGWNLK